MTTDHDALAGIEAAWAAERAGYERDLDTHFARYVAELEELCALPSLSSDESALWACGEFLERKLDRKSVV